MPNTIMSEEFLAKAKSTKSFEELKSLVAAEGVEVVDDELMAKWEMYSSEDGVLELEDDELDNVAGGCGEKKEEPKEYDVIGDWAPSCPEGYFVKVRSKGVPTSCANCKHFYPKERETKQGWRGPGKCRREFERWQ